MGTLARLFGVKAAVPNISEDGTFIVTPGSWGLNWALPSRSGTTVTPDGALGIVSVYACVRVIAESVASLPLRVYRRLPEGGKERANDHELYRVLHDQPNPEMTSFVWRETVLSHLLTWGNSYNEITRDDAGQVQLWPLNPARVEVKWEDGRRQYDYLKTSGRQRLRPGSVFHIPGLSSNGLVGYSPITVHREALGLYQALENFGSSFMANQARPGFVVMHPNTLSIGAQERLATQMDAVHGSANAGKTVVLEEGISLKEIGVPPEDAQYIEGRKFQRSEVAAMFRVPLHKIGDLEHATFSNIEHQAIEFVTDTLRPWTVRIEQEINAQLIQDPDFYAEFLIDGLLRGDAAGRAQSLAVQLEHGVITENEWRAIENRNPWEVDRRWTPVANHKAALIDADGNPVAEGVEEEPVEEPVDEEPFPEPRLVRVKSVEVRCSGRLASGEPCDKLLAEKATAPYRMTCSRCKAVSEATEHAPDIPPPVLTIIGTRYEYDDLGRVAAVVDIPA